MVVSVMKTHTYIELVEIQGHTDDVGDDDRNMRLSDARTKSVMNYLVFKCIDAQRLTQKGYGETMPLTDCKHLKGKVSISAAPRTVASNLRSFAWERLKGSDMNIRHRCNYPKMFNKKMFNNTFLNFVGLLLTMMLGIVPYKAAAEDAAELGTSQALQSNT